METRAGVSGTVCDSIFFTEARVDAARSIKHIHVEISRQNSDLAELKRSMAAEASACGATAIMNFRYGQKKHEWYENFFFKWDTESWHGEGDAIAL